MDAQVINFKEYSSGALAGFFDLSVSGIVVTGCKAFRKQGDNGEDRLWFSWPSEKTEDRDGNEKWRDIVTAAEPVMRHLQGIVRVQLKALLDSGNGSRAGSKRTDSTAAPRSKTPEGEDLSEYRSAPGGDDIPF
jgi:hypothetical protein